MTLGSSPEDCSFLGGNRPGKYYCKVVTENIVPDARTMVAIGEGCCSPLNSDRGIAIMNRKDPLGFLIAKIMSIFGGIL